MNKREFTRQMTNTVFCVSAEVDFKNVSPFDKELADSVNARGRTRTKLTSAVKEAEALQQKWQQVESQDDLVEDDLLKIPAEVGSGCVRVSCCVVCVCRN